MKSSLELGLTKQNEYNNELIKRRRNISKLYLHFNANKREEVNGTCKSRCQFPIFYGFAMGSSRIYRIWCFWMV